MDTSNREVILAEIRRLAEATGQTPRQSDLVRELGISNSQIFKFFPRWTDAVRAAGLEPFKWQNPNPATSEAALLEDWAALVRKYGRPPTTMEYGVEGKFSVSTFAKHFGSWRNLPARVTEFASGKLEWADVEDILNNNSGWERDAAAQNSALSSSGKAFTDSEIQSVGEAASAAPISPKAASDRIVGDGTYGPPINFRGLQHEPVNEQGVVFVFGMVARELGYFVEAVQQGFPDCEAKREATPGRFKRIRIEFEFESKNFLAHAHPVDGCDLIVCWRDNWLNRPNSLEVLELSSAIKKLPNR